MLVDPNTIERSFHVADDILRVGRGLGDTHVKRKIKIRQLSHLKESKFPLLLHGHELMAILTMQDFT